MSYYYCSERLESSILTCCSVPTCTLEVGSWKLGLRHLSTGLDVIREAFLEVRIVCSQCTKFGLEFLLLSRPYLDGSCGCLLLGSHCKSSYPSYFNSFRLSKFWRSCTRSSTYWQRFGSGICAQGSWPIDATLVLMIQVLDSVPEGLSVLLAASGSDLKV